jgi:hypothetical protein
MNICRMWRKVKYRTNKHKGVFDMTLLILIIIIHITLTLLTLKFYREACLITNGQPDIMMIIFATVPFINLVIMNYSMEEINEKLPFKQTLAEVLLGIKQEHYWTNDEEKDKNDFM